MAFAAAALAQAVSTTTVQGTVFLANGSPGSGTLQLSWPAFTTASSQAITAGKVTAAIGADGFVTVNLAPNLGSSPAGLYYTAIYHLSDGTTSTEYWVVPAAAQATIAQVRSQVMPAAQATQAVSKAYVDQAIQSVAQGNLTSTGGQLTGPLYLTGDPTQSLQASDKHYVDASFAQAVPMSGGAVNGPLTAQQLGAAYQVDQFSGVDFGAKLQACVSAINRNYGGTCDARNFSGTLAMASNVTISGANTTVMLPCATITTGSEIIVPAGIRNVSLRGCALRGASDGSGSQGGTVLFYSGASAAVQVGDPTYASNTLGFHLDNVVINTTPASSANAQGLAAYRTQEIDLQSLYLLGNANQTGITLDGTGNYTGGTFYDNHISGFQTAIKGIGHQVTNSAATDWLNASAFVRLHIDCPTSGGNPIAGTYGVNLQQGDGNTFTGGDVENCGTALHLGANAQNNTIMGLRNENSTYQVVADPGSAYNSWITGGTMFTGKLTDNGTRNSFLDSFHRSFNSLNGDWYGSQQDATLTNHYRLGIGSGNERGLLDRYQTDGGYRWTTGLSDATGGAQFYQVLDELNGVYRLSIGQYNSGQASTNNQTVVNSAGTGAVILNGSNNAGTGGVVFGSGGANESTVATVSNTGNAQFMGTLQVGGTTQSTGTMTVRNNADSEVDYYLWPGLSNSQKGSFTYKDWNGSSQWYLVKDASNNWALNSAVGGLDSIKAYQSNNSGDTYINASNASGVVRVNYETGAGSAFNIYGGNSSNLYASFSGNTSIKFPGLSAPSGRNCLQIDSSGFISNTGAACGGGSGTVNNGSTGQIAYYNSGGTSVSGINTIPVSAGGTGASTAVGALAALNGVSTSTTAPQSLAGPLNASVNSQINVIAYGAKGDCATDDTAAFTAAQTAALTYQTGNSLPAALYLPKPPGGCYIVSNWTWKGVSLLGPATTGLAAASPYQSAVTLKSKPGQDVLHVPDPTYTTGTITVNPGWAIENVSFIVDNSIAGAFPHRWPGRHFDDGAIASGSAVFTSANAKITCGDVGQAIQINGAGAGGTNLVTTIASVNPCWIPSTQSGVTSWQVVTLATTASTTVTNAHSYISVLGLPVTENIGNCAIAFDMADGNRSNWVGTTAGGNYGRMDNVTFATTSGQNNDVCGIFTQGNPYLYGLRVDNFAFFNQKFAVVQTASEFNSINESNAGDFQLWNHGIFFLPWNPWISINGLSNKLKHVQYNTNSGVQIMQLANNAYDTATGWDIDLGGEAPTGATVYGHRIDGNDETITGDFTTGAVGQVGYADVNSSIINGGVNNTQLNGFGNLVTAPNITTGVIDNGYGNIVKWIYSGNTSPNGMAMNYWVCGSFCKGSSNLAGRFTPDFLEDGNFSTPYNHDDQLIMPKDVVLDPGAATFSQYIVTDSTAKSGVALMVSGSAPTSYYYAFMPYNELSNTLKGITVGTNFPTTGGMFYFSARCPTGSTFTAYAKASTVFSQSFTCTTSYKQYSIPMTFAGGDIGQPLQFGGSSGTNPFYLEWAAFVPRPNFPAGTTIGGAGVATGPSSGTAANDMVCYANSTGLMQDCNTATNPGITSSAGLNYTLKASAGGMNLALNAPSSSYNVFLQWYYGATRYWNAGMSSGTAWVLNDYQNAHNVISFPNNTMPANSIGGNANGATAITQAASDNSTNIATDAFVKANLPLSGTTASIGGSALALGACASGMVNVTGATNSMAVVATPATYPGDGMVWRPYVSSAGVVTVKVCAAVAGTPVASTYIVRVIP